MSSQNNSSSGGIGLSGILLVVFIILKLTHVIDWSWWWVLSPLWIDIGIWIIVILIAGAISLMRNM